LCCVLRNHVGHCLSSQAKATVRCRTPASLLHPVLHPTSLHPNRTKPFHLVTRPPGFRPSPPTASLLSRSYFHSEPRKTNFQEAHFWTTSDTLDHSLRLITSFIIQYRCNSRRSFSHSALDCRCRNFHPARFCAISASQTIREGTEDNVF
jgi:hypothetical protein